MIYIGVAISVAGRCKKFYPYNFATLLPSLIHTHTQILLRIHCGQATDSQEAFYFRAHYANGLGVKPYVMF